VPGRPNVPSSTSGGSLASTSFPVGPVPPLAPLPDSGFVRLGRLIDWQPGTRALQRMGVDMGHCKLCDRKGFRVSVGNDGLCESCRPRVAISVGSRLRVVNDSTKLVVESKNYETRLSRCKLAMDHLSDIKREYEDRSITVMSPRAADILAKLRSEYPTLVQQAVEQIVKEAKQKADVASTPTAKGNAFGKGALALGKLREQESGFDEAIQSAEQEMRKSIDRVRATSIIDDGQKAEFKGNSKKALDRYLEALYLVLVDKTDDREQREMIATLEANITRLGGEVSRVVSPSNWEAGPPG